MKLIICISAQMNMKMRLIKLNNSMTHKLKNKMKKYSLCRINQVELNRKRMIQHQGQKVVYLIKIALLTMAVELEFKANITNQQLKQII